MQNGQEGESTTIYGPGVQAETDKRSRTTEQPKGPLIAEGCGKIAEFLAQAPWNEQRDRLSATQIELEKHLNSHNSTCRRLTMMLEELPTEAIPTADSKILQQMHRILQNSMLPGWPQEWLQPETSTPGFDVFISEIAQFETLRLGFLLTLKNTLLKIYDKFSNTPTTETAEPQPQLAHFLDMRPALKWVQFILLAELTHSSMKSTTLQDTFGPFGKIAEIFLFKPQPEGFIIFHGNLKIPNIHVMVSPQHNLIMIKNPNYLSLLIRSAVAPHLTTRRPALGTLVTLPLLGYDWHEATVVAIEQNYWPMEWTYMIRMEEIGKPPELIMTILDRGSLNLQDISTRISPKAIVLNEGDTAFFFDKFERTIQVTIIQQGNPGFYETVRNVTLLRPVPHDDIFIQPIESHRLFTANINPSDTAKLREDVPLETVSKSIINWGPKTPWNITSDTMEDTTVTNPAPPQVIQTETKSNPHLGAGNVGVTELAKMWAANAMDKEIRESLPTGRHTVVIPKKRRPRKVWIQKILVLWRNFTIPCTYSDRLTPATLIEDIGRSQRATPGSLIKATLTPRNSPMGTLHLDMPLSMQGIEQGDTLLMLV